MEMGPPYQEKTIRVLNNATCTNYIPSKCFPQERDLSDSYTRILHLQYLRTVLHQLHDCRFYFSRNAALYRESADLIYGFYIAFGVE